MRKSIANIDETVLNRSSKMTFICSIECWPSVVNKSGWVSVTFVRSRSHEERLGH
jgi:hypothetical protein